jgi:hypothetical protein
MNDHPSLRFQTEMAQSLRQAQIVADVMDTIFPSLATIRKPTKFAYLMVNEGPRVRCVGSNFYGDCGLNHTNQWAWIVGHMISEFGCEPDDVSCVETDDGDKIAVAGKIVGELVVE